MYNHEFQENGSEDWGNDWNRTWLCQVSKLYYQGKKSQFFSRLKWPKNYPKTTQTDPERPWADPTLNDPIRHTEWPECDPKWPNLSHPKMTTNEPNWPWMTTKWPELTSHDLKVTLNNPKLPCQKWPKMTSIDPEMTWKWPENDPEWPKRSSKPTPNFQIRKNFPFFW